MHIKNLKLYNFRNLRDCEIEFSPGINFIYGNNGQGKTNIVEAISFLSWGKSFRTGSPREMVTWDESEASVFAELVRSGEDESLGISIKNGRKKGYLFGDPVKSLNEYLGRFICVSFSPTDLMLVQGAPKERRNFIDRHLTALNPELISVFANYTKSLKSKNRILKEGTSDINTIIPWNTSLAETGSKIYQARKNFIETLSEKAGKIHQEFGKADGWLKLELISDIPLEIAEDKEKLFEELKEAFQKESIIGKSIIGCHKDDMHIGLGNKKARSFASQGQSRSIVLSLILAATDLIEETRNCSPVILLDDVDSELDPDRAKRFFELIWNQSRQICITGTNPRMISGSFKSEPKFFKISGGLVTDIDEKKIAI